MNAGAQVSFLEKGSSRFWSLITGIFLHIWRIEKQGPDSRTSMMTAPRCNNQTSSSGWRFSTGTAPQGWRVEESSSCYLDPNTNSDRLTLEGRVSDFRIWQLLWICHWKSVTREDHWLLWTNGPRAFWLISGASYTTSLHHHSFWPFCDNRLLGMCM